MVMAHVANTRQKYKPRGDENLSSRVAELLRKNGLECAIDPKQGIVPPLYL
jgi:hypothetical protein